MDNYNVATGRYKTATQHNDNYCVIVSTNTEFAHEVNVNIIDKYNNTSTKMKMIDEQAQILKGALTHFFGGEGELAKSSED